MGIRKQYADLSISEEDRLKLVRYRARAMVAESGNPNMSVEDAIGALSADIDLLRELRQRYEIPPDESVAFSLLDGMITEVDEES